jgi:hypothetical protein
MNGEPGGGFQRQRVHRGHGQQPDTGGEPVAGGHRAVAAGDRSDLQPSYLVMGIRTQACGLGWDGARRWRLGAKADPCGMTTRKARAKTRAKTNTGILPLPLRVAQGQCQDDGGGNGSGLPSSRSGERRWLCQGRQGWTLRLRESISLRVHLSDAPVKP